MGSMKHINCETGTSEMGFPSASQTLILRILVPKRLGMPRDFLLRKPIAHRDRGLFLMGMFSWGDFCRENLGMYKTAYIYIYIRI